MRCYAILRHPRPPLLPVFFFLLCFRYTDLLHPATCQETSYLGAFALALLSACEGLLLAIHLGNSFTISRFQLNLTFQQGPPTPLYLTGEPVQPHPALPSPPCPIIFSFFSRIYHLLYNSFVNYIHCLPSSPVPHTFYKSGALCTSLSQQYPSPEGLEPQSRCSVNICQVNEWLAHTNPTMWVLFTHTFVKWFRKLLEITGQEEEALGLKSGPYSSPPEVSVLHPSPPFCHNLEHNYGDPVF